MPTIQRVTKECLNCGGEFSRPPSLAHLVCCSRECSIAHSRRFQQHKTCPACGGEFTCSKGSKQEYCSNQCRGKVGGRKRGQRITRTCPVCGKDFEVTPSGDYIKTCSVECGYKVRDGQPKKFSAKGYANLKGRPKKSKDVERTCPTCGTKFTVTDRSTQKYCSRPCEFASRAERQRLARLDSPSSRLTKNCASCGEPFEVYRSQSHLQCCSMDCAMTLRTGRAAEEVREMTDVERAWFAGLFDGEGSIVLRHRSRPGGGSILITITNTVRPLLDRVREVTGTGHIEFFAKSELNPRHADVYTWACGGARAKTILTQVRPWLIVKADRADAVMEDRVFPRQSRWDDIYPDSGLA